MGGCRADEGEGEELCGCFPEGRRVVGIGVFGVGRSSGAFVRFLSKSHFFFKYFLELKYYLLRRLMQDHGLSTCSAISVRQCLSG